MRFAIATAAIGLAAAASPAWALYKCGNTYQDRPCDAGVPQQQLAPAGRTPSARGAASPGTLSSPYAVACARVGERAQQMSWKREGGATMERQMAELPNDGNRGEWVALLQSVYARRGSTPEIRAAIEAECVAERQKQAEAAEMLKALQKQAGTASPATGGPAPAAPAADAGARQGAATPQPVAARPAVDARCSGWKSDKESAEFAMRRGGSAADMEYHQARRREAEQNLAGAKC